MDKARLSRLAGFAVAVFSFVAVVRYVRGMGVLPETQLTSLFIGLIFGFGIFAIGRLFGVFGKANG